MCTLSRTIETRRRDAPPFFSFHSEETFRRRRTNTRGISLYDFFFFFLLFRSADWNYQARKNRKKNSTLFSFDRTWKILRSVVFGQNSCENFSHARYLQFACFFFRRFCEAKSEKITCEWKTELLKCVCLWANTVRNKHLTEWSGKHESVKTLRRWHAQNSICNWNDEAPCQSKNQENSFRDDDCVHWWRFNYEFLSWNHWSRSAVNFHFLLNHSHPLPLTIDSLAIDKIGLSIRKSINLFFIGRFEWSANEISSSTK